MENQKLLESLKELTLEIKEIRSDYHKVNNAIDKFNQLITFESKWREKSEDDIEKIKSKLEFEEKEKKIIEQKLTILDNKIIILEHEIKDSKEFRDSFRKNLWKAFWWVMGIASAAITLATVVFQNFFKA